MNATLRKRIRRLERSARAGGTGFFSAVLHVTDEADKERQLAELRTSDAWPDGASAFIVTIRSSRRLPPWKHEGAEPGHRPARCVEPKSA